MPASAPGPGSAPQEYSSSPAEQAARPSENGRPAPGSSTQMNLLEAVLRQTALSSVTDDSRSNETFTALSEVARQFRGHAFGLDPVAVELVHASLESQFKLLGSPDRDWKALSARIAKTLFDDPVAHDQLEALWKQLSEAA